MSQAWNWLDKQGVQRAVDAQQLIDAILDGRVSADAPVWRPGMPTFVPASRVQLFAAACKQAGSRAGDATVSREPPGATAAPTPEAKAALQRTLAQAKGKRSVAPPPPTPKTPAAPSASPKLSPAPKPAPAASPPSPEPHKEDLPTRRLGSIRPGPPSTSDTARPPSKAPRELAQGKKATLAGMAPIAAPAVPPPADATPIGHGSAAPTKTLPLHHAPPVVVPPAQEARVAAVTVPSFDAVPPVAQPSPAAGPTGTPPSEPPPAVASVDVDRFEDTPPATPIARESRKSGDVSAETAEERPALWPVPEGDSAVNVVAVPVRRSNPSLDWDTPSVIVPKPSVPPPPEPSRAEQTLRTRAIRSNRLLIPVIGFVAAIAVLGVIALLVYAIRSPSKPSGKTAPLGASASASAPPAAAASSTTSPATAPSPRQGSTTPCVFRGVRKRIVVGASKDVPIEVWAQPDDARIAVGFAAQKGSALGFVLDPNTLEPKKSFADKTRSPIRRVVPTASGESITFAVDVDDPQASLQNTLTVATTPPIRLGTFKDAITIESTTSSVPDVLWTQPVAKPLQAMRAAVIPTKGMAIVFRMDDGVWLGWVTEDRKPLGKLTRVPGTGVQVGTPSIAWNGRDVLVTFADLPAKDAPWAIRLARVPYGGDPLSSSAWDVPEGGPGGSAIAPSAFGLADGRWLMVWTEGKPGSRDVRAQTYDSSMGRLGDAFTVSESGANAGQGIAAVGSAGGVIMYLSVLGRLYEVWGASIECP